MAIIGCPVSDREYQRGEAKKPRSREFKKLLVEWPSASKGDFAAPDPEDEKFSHGGHGGFLGVDQSFEASFKPRFATIDRTTRNKL
jgi:hypothetical protein